MPLDRRSSPPGPVAAVAAFDALLAAAPLIFAVVMLAAGASGLALLGLVALLPGAVALGLWQGNRGARVAAIILTLPSLVGALIVTLLLVVPESSRAWFARDAFGHDNPDGAPPRRW